MYFLVDLGHTNLVTDITNRPATSSRPALGGGYGWRGCREKTDQPSPPGQVDDNFGADQLAIEDDHKV